MSSLLIILNKNIKTKKLIEYNKIAKNILIILKNSKWLKTKINNPFTSNKLNKVIIIILKTINKLKFILIYFLDLIKPLNLAKSKLNPVAKATPIIPYLTTKRMFKIIFKIENTMLLYKKKIVFF